MKSIKNSIFAVLSCGLLFSACTEEQRGQFPTDSTAPQQVSNPAVANFPGGATITYQLPDESDLLYVKCIYQLPDGSTQQVKSSVFSNSLTIKGYSRSMPVKVKLVSVDRSQNESQPVEVDIHPEDSPIHAIMESLNIEEDWGGFSVEWQNPLKEDIVFTALRQNDEGIFESVENIYSSTANVAQAVRGLESKQSNFAFCIRDLYGNYSDTLKKPLTPWFEAQLDKSKFIPLAKSSRLSNAEYPSSMSVLWDGVELETGNGNNMYTFSPAGSQLTEPYFGIDLGVNVKLSRFRFWSRSNYLFALRSPKKIQLFGTDNPLVANNADSPDSDWIELTLPPYWESIRPSGKTIPVVEGDEDYVYAMAGEEILFPFPLADIPVIRYFRFKCLESWTGPRLLQLVEIRFWGDTSVPQ
ncbi:hypothetical protein FACS1894199_06430 [Bacteroidia bacterium]|nr:hypothetical protein FACS1894199_06430 [Bacteroidia bacterium]